VATPVRGQSLRPHRGYPGTPAGPDTQQGSRGQHQFVGGKIAMATYGPYAGTKFVLEAVSDSLRREIAPSGVQVVVVELGAVRTEMPGRAIATAQHLASTMTPEQSQRYGALVHAITAQTASHTNSGLPADAAAKVIAKAVTARKPRTRYTIGRDAATAHPLGAHPARPDTRPRICRRSASPLSQREQMGIRPSRQD
jgi:NAD(P)-dependent dehydrogenase (short-subunit alcohol dehydrogenase family)